jgi:hypothetical protein
MARILTFSMVEDYLKSLSEKHVDIKDFVGTSIAELASKLTSFAGIESPIFIFYNITGQLSGTKQRSFNTRRISFAIAYARVPTDDFQKQKEAKNNAEQIGLDVLSRINYDSKIEGTGWLYNNFLKDTVTYEVYEDEEVEGLYGMDFSFELKLPEPLVAEPAKWTDGDTICT